MNANQTTDTMNSHKETKSGTGFQPVSGNANRQDACSTPATNNDRKDFDEWAKVELFGHQVIVGRVTQATLAGGAFVRVDVPAVNGHPAFTRFFGPSAIYSISPVTEQIARDLLQVYRNEPVTRYELPQLPAPSEEDESDV